MLSERQRGGVVIGLALSMAMSAFVLWPAAAEVQLAGTSAPRADAPVEHVPAGGSGSEATEAAETKTAAAEPSEAEAETPEAKAEPEQLDPAFIAIASARAMIGTPYRWGGIGPNSFDCSGLTQFAYRKAGIELPHNSSAQHNAVKSVSVDELQPGDLVFSGSGGIGHVGLYIGDGQMIHSPQSGETVRVSPLRRNLIGAGRPVA